MKYENQEEDKKEGEKLVVKFYESLSDNDYNEAFNLFSDEFFEVTSRKDLYEIFLSKEKDLGKIIEFKLVSWSTIRVEGTSPKTEYVFIYKVTYENDSTKETIYMIRENNLPKIIGYDIENYKE